MAQSGNGIDSGTIYRLLTQMSARLDQLLAVVNDHSRILGDHARDLADLKAETREMRSEVRLYHEAVTSQGIHYSDLEGRLLRVERHLKLESPGE